MISFNTAPIPLWNLRDLTGEPLASGKMYTYRDTNRSEFKPVYVDSSGLLAYTNPVVFNSSGFSGPFYWASDENYYLVIKDVNDQVVRTIPSFNASGGGSGPVTNEVNFTNIITDPYFRFIPTLSYSPAPTSVQLGASNWIFNKTNATGTDSINIIHPANGTIDPPFNPYAYFQYSCTVAGSGDNKPQLFWNLRYVTTLQNSEVTLFFWGRCDSGANTVESLTYQYFGAGGTASAPVLTSNAIFNLTSSWAQYSITFTVPSIAGKVIDGISHIDFILRFASDAATTIELTNIQLNEGNKILPYEYLPANYRSHQQIPLVDSLDTGNRYLISDVNKHLQWAPIPAPPTPPPTPFYHTFECVSPNVGLANTPTFIPLTFAGGNSNWFAGGIFKPPISCVVNLTLNIHHEANGVSNLLFWLEYTGGTHVAEVSFRYNGGLLEDHSQLTITGLEFDGVTDSVTLLGRHDFASLANCTVEFGSGSALVFI